MENRDEKLEVISEKVEQKASSKGNSFSTWLYKDNNIDGVIGFTFIAGILVGLWYLANWIFQALLKNDYNLLLKIFIYFLFSVPIYFILRYFHQQSDNVKLERAKAIEERHNFQESLRKEKMDVFFSIQNNINQQGFLIKPIVES